MKKHVWILGIAVAAAARIAGASSGAAGAGAAHGREIVQLDGGKGQVEFSATGHPSALKIVGKGGAPKGTFKLAGQSVTGTSTFELTTLDTGIDVRTQHMKEKYLETEKYPQAKLTVSRLDLPKPLVGDATFDRVPFTGTLSLHGTEHAVSGFAKIAKTGAEVAIDAQFGIKIGDYGIAVPKFAGITMADDVQVEVLSSGALRGGSSAGTVN